MDRKVMAYVTILADSDNKKNKTDWHQFVGVLKDSKLFEGDPVDIQRAMRDEWS